MLWGYGGSTGAKNYATDNLAGIAAPQTVGAAPPAASPGMRAGTPVTRANPDSSAASAISTDPFDRSKIAAAQQAQNWGPNDRKILDGKMLLGVMNPIAAPRFESAAQPAQTVPWDGDLNAPGVRLVKGGPDQPASYVRDLPAQPATYVSSNGTKVYQAAPPPGADPNGTYFADTYDNPTGNGSRDQAKAIYQIMPDGKAAVPVAAQNNYEQGWFTDWGRTALKIAAVVGTAGAAGAYIGGGSAAAGAGAAEGAAAASGAAAGGSAGLTSAQAAALYGAEGYGATGGATAAGGLASAGGAGLADVGAGAGGYVAQAAGATQLAPVTITGAAPAAAAAAAPAAAGGIGLGQVATGATAAGGLASAGGGSSGNGLSSADRSALNSNTGYTGSPGGTGSTIGDMAQKADQSVADYLKTPAGAKAAMALAGAAYGAANAGTMPKAGVNGAGGDTAGSIASAQTRIADQNAARNAGLQSQSDPLYDQLIKNNSDQAAKLNGYSNNQFAGYNADFAPVEQKYAQTALNYDTPGRREQEAQIAVNDQATRFAAAQDDRNRSMFANGVDASSGKALALDNSARIAQAQAEAGGANYARRQVENTGLSLIQNASNFGQQKINTGLSLANASTNTGNAAAGLSNQQQNISNNNATTTSGLYGNVNNSLGTQANINNGLFNQQQQTYQNKNDRTSDWLGAAGQIAGSYFSSKQLKNEVGGVDKEKAAIAVASTPIHAWTYKPGAVAGDDGSLKIGKYAEDSQAATGLGDGTKLDAASENGLNQATLQYLLEKEAARDPKLRKKLAAAMAERNKSAGLADARRMR